MPLVLEARRVGDQRADRQLAAIRRRNRRVADAGVDADGPGPGGRRHVRQPGARMSSAALEASKALYRWSRRMPAAATLTPIERRVQGRCDVIAEPFDDIAF